VKFEMHSANFENLRFALSLLVFTETLTKHQCLLLHSQMNICIGQYFLRVCKSVSENEFSVPLTENFIVL